VGVVPQLPLLLLIDDDDRSRLIILYLVQHVKMIFDCLCARSLLEKCVLGVTLNHNDNYKRVLWNHCSNTDFNSCVTMRLAVSVAILTFNGGMSSLTTIMRELGIQLGSLGHCSLASKDFKRIECAEAKALPEAQQK